MPETSGSSGSGGTDWASIISSGVQLVSVGVGASQASITACGKECRTKCKSETGWLFSGRNKCKKACKADCIAKANEPKTKKPNPASLIIISIVVLAIIGVILWWMFRKK